MLCFGISKLMFNNFWLLMMHGRKLQTLGTCALQNLGSLRKFEPYDCVKYWLLLLLVQSWVQCGGKPLTRWNPTRMIVLGGTQLG
nr:hypothetical protein CFP56_68586 [Quercus suber]